MSFNQVLASQIRTYLNEHATYGEKEMFGGIGFMLTGNMVCGVIRDSLIVRVGAEHHDAAIALPHTRLFDITGRVMKGWVVVDPPGVQNAEDLHEWIQRGLTYTRTLPAKKEKKK